MSIEQAPYFNIGYSCQVNSMEDYFDGKLKDVANGYLGFTSEECDTFCQGVAAESSEPICCAKAEFYIFETDQWAIDCGVAKTDMLMEMPSDYAMEFTAWADYYSYIVETNGTSNATAYGDEEGKWDYGMEEGKYDYGMEEGKYDYGDYYEDEMYETAAVDYDLMYSYAPWDWGMSETWMDQYMCADVDNYLNMT